MKKSIIALSLFTMIIAGCVSQPGQREQMGTLLGAGTGALVGSQMGSGTGRLVAVAIGTLAGALIGQDVGRTLDAADRMAMEQNAQYALEHAPTNAATPWRNPDSGNSGNIIPIETYKAKTGEYCREYQQTVRIGGEVQKAYGTACRQPDGSWKIIR
ncbi:RT0821/Lpp0805 family surface protein [Geopsychrobacter electrodiphilus]|uniref:RT0821/Lpp0805 family surface protein n=1 Tax=Geopsychrobacter electrodiphilus TaxID=225196 RepID=UPI0003780393|nr:RT0821/Lpp0805 family surface protein [Geopsychrobacter electrodiphilus]